jgi:Glycosyl hydrolases family 2, sugar binding domain.
MTIFKTAYRPLFPLLALPLITLSLTLSGCGQSEHSAGNTKTDISINSQNNAANIDESNYIARQNFNSGWNFFKSSSAATLEDALNQQEWQPVNLPHSANIEPRIVNDQWQGDAWYKKLLVSTRTQKTGKASVLFSTLKAQ